MIIRNNSLLDSHSRKNPFFNQFTNNLIIKKPLLINSKLTQNYTQKNIFSANKSNKENEISISLNNNNNNEKIKNKYKKILLPSLSSNSNTFQTLILSTKTNESKDNTIQSQKKLIKLKKIKLNNENGRYLSSFKNNRYLNKLYHEDLELKKKFERFKKNNIHNLSNFSFKNYNIKLLRLSSINLSSENYQIFKKNMQNIECGMKGIKLQRKNRWINFLERIENFAPEGLKQKLINLSLSKDKKYERL